MDLRQLEILQAIAETGSFTACGRKLHVSQSAISRQIALLEDELGEPLFLRVGRVHVIAPVLGLEKRPAVGGFCLLHRFLGVQAMSHQRDDGQQRGDDGHGEADLPLRLSVRLFTDFRELFGFHSGR